MRLTKVALYVVFPFMGVSEKPEGGVDYPHNFNEFEFFFVNEAACQE